MRCRFNATELHLLPSTSVSWFPDHGTIGFTCTGYLTHLHHYLGHPSNSVTVHVTHVKFRTVNYACTPSFPLLHFPLLVCFSFQLKQAWVLWNNSKNLTGISHHSLPFRTLNTPPAETSVPSLKYPFWVCHSDSVEPYWVWTCSCLPRLSISLLFTLFEVNATRQQNNETDRAFHHKHRLWGHFLQSRTNLKVIGTTAVGRYLLNLCLSEFMLKRCN